VSLEKGLSRIVLYPMYRVRSASPNLISLAAVHFEGSSCPSIYTYTFKVVFLEVKGRS
jgi:hypothetical protein